MESHSIKIGPEFFQKARNDYADWMWAVVREFLQNSIDAPRSDWIGVTTSVNADGNTVLTVSNNGKPMSREELLDKLLCLGGSGKNFQDGAVGGFGKAKEVLYLCHVRYLIRTGEFVVNGSGAEYTLSTDDKVDGTVSSIEIEGNVKDDLDKRFRLFAALAKWRGELVLNDVRLHCQLNRGRKVREYEWCSVHAYKHDGLGGRLIVRIGGIPMFTRLTRVDDKVVIVELAGNSVDSLQSSRDALQYAAQGELDDFLAEIAIDKKSALRRPEPKYQCWYGNKLGWEKQQAVFAEVREQIVAAAALSADPAPAKPAISDESNNPASATEPSSNVLLSKLGHQFVIKNNLDRPVPNKMKPENFSAYARKLCAGWARCLLEIWRLFEIEDEFSIGFIFDSDRLAEYERSDEYGHVFYINPYLPSESEREQAWRFSSPARFKVIAVAAHEFTHYLGHDYHDENYTSCYTNNVEPVMLSNARSFNHCFTNN